MTADADSSLKVAARAYALMPPSVRRRWIGLVPLAVVSGLLEAFAALLVFALLRLVTDPAALQDIPIAGDLRAMFPNVSERAFVVGFGVGVGIYYLVKAAFRMLETYARQSVVHRAAVMLAGDLLARYMHAPIEFHLERHSTSLIRNTDAAVNHLCGTVLNSATSAISEILMALGVLTVLLIAAPTPTLIAAALLAVVTIGVIRAMQSKHSRWGEVNHEMVQRVLLRLGEAFRGIKEVRAHGLQNRFVDRARMPREALADVSIRRGTAEVVPRIVVETIFVVGVVAALVIAVSEEADSGELLATLGLMAYALMKLLPSISQIVYYLNSCRFGGPAVRSVAEDLAALPVPPDATDAAPSDLPAVEAVVMENISFGYPDTEKLAVSGIDLRLAKGELIGIVGATGSGKTTLIDLITGVLDPACGRVDYVGQNGPLTRAERARSLGYVAQTGFFVDDTLRLNIALGGLRSEVDDRAIQEAIRTAQLDAFAVALPDGLDTPLGEDGVRTSGGERQRIAIARALYRDPQVLVLDEATSALDPQTERHLIEALTRDSGSRITVMISHRIDSLKIADRLIYLADGHIVDIGTYDELSARSDAFRATAAMADAATTQTKPDSGSEID